jgi:BRCA1/BRCA2-containing complex subunit 3
MNNSTLTRPTNNSVSLAEGTVRAMVTHAFTAEREEVMGLLIGVHERTSSGSATSVRRCHVLRRTVKQRDRVEISPEQLAQVSAEAELEGLHVVGWFHSHPHSTFACRLMLSIDQHLSLSLSLSLLAG